MSYIKVARLLVLVLPSLPLAPGATAALVGSSGITHHAHVLMPAKPIRSQVQLSCGNGSLCTAHTPAICAMRSSSTQNLTRRMPCWKRTRSSTANLARVHEGQPSLCVASTGTRARELLRFPFYIRAHAQALVLASASCLFSRQTAEAIEAQPEMLLLFRDSAQWAAADDAITAFAAIQIWNEASPSYRLGAWALRHALAEIGLLR